MAEKAGVLTFFFTSNPVLYK